MEKLVIKQAMLMCAGRGERMRPFTLECPKVLIPVMGIPLVQFGVDQLIAHGVTKIVANIHYKPEKMRTGLGQLDLGSEASLLLSDESDLLLGSAGGLRKALPLFDEGPFFVCNADVISNVQWDALAEHHNYLKRTSGVSVTYAVFPKGPPGSTYTEILFDPKSYLMTGLKFKQIGRPFFTGAAVVEPEAVAHLGVEEPADFISDILIPSIEKGRAGVFFSKGTWFDIGQPVSWRDAHIELIHALQNKRNHGQWMDRILSLNEEVKKGVWISKRSKMQSCQSWDGPSYWDAGLRSSLPPKYLGHKAILYGGIDGMERYENGIGLAGNWCEL